jgi:hypothetical protein
MWCALGWLLVLVGAGVWDGAATAVTTGTTVTADIGSETTVVDDFDAVAGWTAHPADGVELAIRSDAGWRGRCLRLDFRFLAGSGYAVARKELALELPENYAFSFRIRGKCAPNHLEFKLIDSTGGNVWWSVRRDLRFPDHWQAFTIKKRQIQFAWGPQGGGEIHHVAAIELAITAGQGGTGSVWIDALELRELPPPGAAPPPIRASASTARDAHDPQLGVDEDPRTAWWSDAADRVPWIAFDLGGPREYGGLVLDWMPDRYASDYDVEASDDAVTWQKLRAVRGSNGGRDYLYLPESESHYLRVRVGRSAGSDGVALAEASLQPLEWSASRAAFFQAVARDAPRGTFPRGMSGEQPYWTVVGVDVDAREALLGEDGAIETGRGRFSIEPFLFADGKLATWSDARIVQTLDGGRLPIPTVEWDLDGLHLGVTAFGTGKAGASSIVMRYRIRNRGSAPSQATLFLALRPFQVNPPFQTLNLEGGTAPIRDIAGAGRTVRVNGERAVFCLTPPTGFGAATFDAGDVVAEHLRAGRLPPQKHVRDAFEAASGALAFRLDLPAGGDREVDVLVPLYPASPAPPLRDAGSGQRWAASALEQCRKSWEERLGRVTVRLPEAAAPVVASLQSQLAYILINRAGPAIQPGTRSYARSWIRDGALTSSALLRLGHPEAARAFIEWYAPHQYPSGKIPCVVDTRGPDPVPEHDSSGEFIFLVAEYYRYTGDRALAERMWPRVQRAAAYLDSLRQERRTPQYEAADQRMFFGLLPPSISHEGYSAKPMHSYWDDFFALRGFADAAFLAGELGRAADQTRLEAVRSEFERELGASIAAAMHHHGIDYIPGCADLGDFDATSTTIALSPVGAEAALPPQALRRTFEKYYEFFRARRDGEPWEAFTPYEVRTIGTCVRLGWRERAGELLDWFLSQQRPAGWRQWPEVVWRDSRAPHFLGDLPHTWVGSDYVRSVLDMLAYERGDTLVVGAGVPAPWMEGPGLEVRDLCTSLGRLSYTMRALDTGVDVNIEAGLRVPPGGIVIRPPLPGPVRAVTLDGSPTRPEAGGSIVVRRLPATLRFLTGS